MDKEFQAWENGEWVDARYVEDVFGLTFEECCKRFEMKRIDAHDGIHFLLYFRQKEQDSKE